jgi:hypothetical protein
MKNFSQFFHSTKISLPNISTLKDLHSHINIFTTPTYQTSTGPSLKPLSSFPCKNHTLHSLTLLCPLDGTIFPPYQTPPCTPHFTFDPLPSILSLINVDDLLTAFTTPYPNVPLILPQYTP